MRIRQSIADLTVGSQQAAQTQDWHPVLDTYARGVQLMKDLDANGPTPKSWLWAANTHGFPQGTPPRPAWGQCQHASPFFLPWHRAYLAWFESTIRELTGEDDWALPYWNYSDPASDRDIPAEFTVPTRTVDGAVVDNPLFSPNRSTDPMPVSDVDLRPALSQPNFILGVADFMPGNPGGFGGILDQRGFGILENLPHNYIHGDIGALMGFTTTAGRDPIFWLHHSNIDRVWELWRGLDGSVELPDSPVAPASLKSQWRSARFWFGDERYPSTYEMAAVEDLQSADMDYEYDSHELPEEIAADVLAIRDVILAEQDGGLGLAETPEWTPIAATPGMTSGEDRSVPLVTGLGLDAETPTSLLLELGGVHGTDPHSVYVVEVRANPAAEPHIAGRFSTFGLAGTTDAETRNYFVDATAVLPALADEEWSGADLAVKVVPERGRADSDDAEKQIVIDQITVYTQTT